MKCRLSIPYIVAIFISMQEMTIVNAASNSTDNIKGTPDLGVSYLTSNLNALKVRVKSLANALTDGQLTPQTASASKSLERAESALQRSDWTAAISEASRFMSLSQKPEPRLWLRAQFIMARGLEEKKLLPKSLTYYSRYLATFSTSPDLNPPELDEVFERTVRIATKDSTLDRSDLSRILSSFLSLEEPRSGSGVQKYVGAVAGSRLGKLELSTKWLGQVDAPSSPPQMRARARYFRALLAMNSKNWPDAQKELESILSLNDISDASLDNAKLSLARVLLRQKKPVRALEYYSQIAKDSPSYRDASFEKISLLISLNKAKEARQEAVSWLSLYPHHPDGLSLKAITSWLDLKSGDLDAATLSIDHTTEKLSSIRSQLKNEFSTDHLTPLTANRLASLVYGHVPESEDLKTIINLSDQLSELEARLIQIEAIERGLVHLLANVDIEAYKPNLAHQIAEFDNIQLSLFEAGEELVDRERLRIGHRLTDSAKYQLSKNAKERGRIFTQAEEIKRQQNRWSDWFLSATDLIELGQAWDRLNTIEAKSSASAAQHMNDPDVQALQKNIFNVRKDMLATLSDLQQKRASNLIAHGSFPDQLSKLAAFSELMRSDIVVLTANTPILTTSVDQLDDNDAREAWQTWSECSSLISSTLSAIKTKATSELRNTLNELSIIEQKKIVLSKQIITLRQDLESVGTKKLPVILSYFDSELTQRIGRQLKWAGDLEYLRYVEKTDEQESLRRKHALEIQILSDDPGSASQKESK